MPATLNPPVSAERYVWLSHRAARLDAGEAGLDVGESLRALAGDGLLGVGVPPALGGSGGTLLDAVELIAGVSEHCLTSGFALWCQRAFIEYLYRTGNSWLQESLLPQILSGDFSGATGLSNAMKHLAGLEGLRLGASIEGGTVTLNGNLPWASNLRPGKFFIAVAAQVDGGRAVVAAVPSDAAGVTRGEDFPLHGLQSTWTSDVRFAGVRLPIQWLISDDAGAFLPRIRPAFVLLQCGLALGVARRSLKEAGECLGHKRHVLTDRVSAGLARLEALAEVVASLSVEAPANPERLPDVFRARIELTRLAVEASWLELEAKGGHAYLRASDTARRLREAAFLPILTPSLTQLEAELERHAGAAGGRDDR